MRRTILAIALVVVLGGMLCPAARADLTWQTTLADAVELAQMRGKKVLLVAGRDSCSITNYTRFTACESTSPDVRGLIDEGFVPWYSHVDRSNEWRTYSGGLGSFTLPLICVIDPDDTAPYLDRMNGYHSGQEHYDFLEAWPPADNIPALGGWGAALLALLLAAAMRRNAGA